MCSRIELKFETCLFLDETRSFATTKYWDNHPLITVQYNLRGHKRPLQSSIILVMATAVRRIIAIGILCSVTNERRLNIWT